VKIAQHQAGRRNQPSIRPAQRHVPILRSPPKAIAGRIEWILLACLKLGSLSVAQLHELDDVHGFIVGARVSRSSISSRRR
jgi:hypothetical protein